MEHGILLKCARPRVTKLQQARDHQQETHATKMTDQRMARLQQMRDHQQEKLDLRTWVCYKISLSPHNALHSPKAT